MLIEVFLFFSFEKKEAHSTISLGKCEGYRIFESRLELVFLTFM